MSLKGKEVNDPYSPSVLNKLRNALPGGSMFYPGSPGSSEVKDWAAKSALPHPKRTSPKSQASPLIRFELDWKQWLSYRIQRPPKSTIGKRENYMKPRIRKLIIALLLFVDIYRLAAAELPVANASYVKLSSGSTAPRDYWSERAINCTPSARQSHTAVWTGSEMIVWGGYNSGRYFNDTWSYMLAPPLCSIQRAGGNAIVSWPISSAGFRLQQNGKLNTTNWISAANPLNVNGTNQVTVSPASGVKFFRLISP
jgi:hypothetical protein